MFVFEKIPFSVNLQKLQGFLFDTVMPIGDPICPIEPGFGGWSVTSDTGDWKDGWRSANASVKLPEQYNKPTQLCVGYMKEIIDQLSDLGMQPTKVRVSCLPPKGHSSIHRDYPSNYFRARLHIPILTNSENCHILYDNSNVEVTRTNMKADGSAYMFWVNLKHQYINLSNENRYHLVMDCKDTKGITENFKCIMQ